MSDRIREPWFDLMLRELHDFRSHRTATHGRRHPLRSYAMIRVLEALGRLEHIPRALARG